MMEKLQRDAINAQQQQQIQLQQQQQAARVTDLFPSESQPSENLFFFLFIADELKYQWS
jgi:hypothetical protein